MNGKALEQRTALAVSAWPVPLLSQDGKLVVEDIPLVVWGLCFCKVGGVMSFLFGPVRGIIGWGHSVS